MYFIPRERCLVEGGHVFHTSGEVFGGGWPCTFYGLGCEPYHAHVFFFCTYQNQSMLVLYDTICPFCS